MSNNLAARGQIAFLGQGNGGEVINVITPAAAAAAMDTGDGRKELKPESRQRIIKKIMSIMTGHPPRTQQEGLVEIGKAATRLEKKIYSSSTSQSDYLKRISMKILTMETQHRPQVNGTDTGQNPSDQGEAAALSTHNPSNEGSGKRLRLNEEGAHSVSTYESTHDKLILKVAKDQVKNKGKRTPEVTADHIVVEREKLKLKQLQLEEMVLGRKEKILKRKNSILICLINLGEKVTPQQAVTRDKLMAELYEAEA